MNKVKERVSDSPHRTPYGVQHTNVINTKGKTEPRVEESNQISEQNQYELIDFQWISFKGYSDSLSTTHLQFFPNKIVNVTL